MIIPQKKNVRFFSIKKNLGLIFWNEGHTHLKLSPVVVLKRVGGTVTHADGSTPAMLVLDLYLPHLHHSSFGVKITKSYLFPVFRIRIRMDPH